MAKRKRINQAAAQALANIELQSQRIEALAWVARGLQAEYGSTPREINEAVSVLTSALYRRLNDFYRSLFMFSLFSPETEAKAKELAYRRFLRERMSIVQYLELDERIPHRYRSSLPDELRQEIEAEIEAEKQQKAAYPDAQPAPVGDA